MDRYVLEAREITKRYPGVLALDSVSFGLGEGEVHALCGENGAGKSTLIKILGGVIGRESYEGELIIRGKPASLRSTVDAEAAGVAVIHQELSLVDGMTVAENVFLGHEPGRLGWVDQTRMIAATAQLLEQFRLDLQPTAIVGTLGMGQKQLVEIARALAKRVQILIFDEPTSALSHHEVRRLLEIVQALRARGVASVYISHKLDEVFALADRITVLRDGRSVQSWAVSETSPEQVVRAMVGRSVEDLFPPRDSAPGELVLEVKDLCVAPRKGAPLKLRDISFSVRAGQVLGIGGLMGAGRSELLMHLFGCYGIREKGEVRFRGQSCPPQPPESLVRQGIVLVTEDRKRYGLVLDSGSRVNLSLSALPALARFGVIDHEHEEERCSEFVRQLGVKTASLEQPVGTLSGGNQQKVVLGRALMTEPKLILLDEPTRGIDIGAKQEIYHLVRRLSRQGLAVVVVSSELPELLGLSDAIIMLRAGQLGGTFEPGASNQEVLLAAAM